MRARLAALLGAEALAEAPGPPRVRPASTAGVAEVLALASREGWKVWPAGTGARRPVRGPAPDLVLSTERLVGLTVYEPEDLTLGARAGSGHGELAAAAARHRQLLPSAPVAGPGATLGGTVALADAGPLRAGYGAPRDLVLGLTVVSGDGRVLTFGGRVVKNVAGYDLVRLLVGSRGSLGVITECHVRLRSLPEVDTTLILDAPEAEAAAALALDVRAAAAPVALEVARADRTGWRIAVRLHGSGAAVPAAAAAVRALRVPVSELSEAEAAAHWQARAAEERAAPLRLRLTAYPDRLAALLGAADDFLKSWSGNANEPSGWCQAHAADGIVRVGCDLSRPGATHGAGALHALAAVTRSIGGTFAYDALPAALGAPGGSLPEPSRPPEPVRRLEGELKARFDPAGVLPEVRDE